MTAVAKRLEDLLSALTTANKRGGSDYCLFSWCQATRRPYAAGQRTAPAFLGQTFAISCRPRGEELETGSPSVAQLGSAGSNAMRSGPEWSCRRTGAIRSRGGVEPGGVMRPTTQRKASPDPRRQRWSEMNNANSLGLAAVPASRLSTSALPLFRQVPPLLAYEPRRVARRSWRP